MHAIIVENLHKQFKVYHDRPKSIKAFFAGGVRPVRETVEVLKGISFTVEPGQTLALVGRNGCGKSTLLSTLAGIYRPDQGTVTVNGRVSPLLELGAGFHPDLTGIDNIYLNASILGLRQAEITSRIGSIIEFSELSHFVDLPIRTYSSGMIARLGFSVAIHTDPDILIVDEVLGVGDAAFQEKCQAKIKELQNNGKTIIFVSHSVQIVRQVSSRAIWIDSGKIRMDGGVDEVTDAYTQDIHKVAAELPHA